MTTNFQIDSSTYTAQLEQQVQALQRTLAEIKPAADKWTPRVTAEMGPDKIARVSLTFGGKTTSVAVPFETFMEYTSHDLTTNFTDALCESLLIEKLREVVRPEVDRLRQGVSSLQGAGKW